MRLRSVCSASQVRGVDVDEPGPPDVDHQPRVHEDAVPLLDSAWKVWILTDAWIALAAPIF
eukprot:COSAG01_NODE_2838_length_6992_cov_21.639779_2_plen_61_part_00